MVNTFPKQVLTERLKVEESTVSQQERFFNLIQRNIMKVVYRKFGWVWEVNLLKIRLICKEKIKQQTSRLYFLEPLCTPKVGVLVHCYPCESLE